MKALEVEFVSAPRVAAWLWVVLGIALALLSAQQALQAFQLQQQWRAAQLDIATLSSQLDQTRRAEREASDQRNAAPRYARDADSIAKMAGFPWNRVLASIENARVQGVKMTSLAIDPAEGSVRIELESTDREGLMRYLGELNAGEEPARWQLLQAQAAANANGISAAIGSNWSPGDRQEQSPDGPSTR